MNKRQIIIKIFMVCLSSIVLVTGRSTILQAQENEGERTLYERLGGVYYIATVVDDFIERLLVNDLLNANPAIREARDRVPKAGLKFRLTEMVCQATGGPEEYNGRTMKEAHQHLNITEAEWDAMVAEFKITLDKFKVPEKEQNELFTIIGSTKGDIVMNSTTTKTKPKRS